MEAGSMKRKRQQNSEATHGEDVNFVNTTVSFNVGSIIYTTAIFKSGQFFLSLFKRNVSTTFDKHIY
ncbi:unnamed protein product [Rhizophagus irregularis]|nr:unnamed protein product [Rhizophagus irregularis]